MPIFRSCASPSRSSAHDNKTPLTLRYFDLPGRGHVLRLLLKIGNVDFVDQRIQFADWPQHKPKAPLGQLPVLILPDGSELPQSIAIAEYIARTINWHPADALEELKVNSVVQTVDDALTTISVWYNTPEDQRAGLKETLTEKFIDKVVHLDRYVASLEKDGHAIGNGKDSVADAFIADFVWQEQKDGMEWPFDHRAVMRENAPTLQKVADRFKEAHKKVWESMTPPYAKA